MNLAFPNQDRLQAQIAELRERLAEYEETLRAIHSGEVDAVVVMGDKGPQVFTLIGAESPYRLLVEQMREGAISLGSEGLIVYSNPRFAEMVRTPLSRVMGRNIQDFIDPADREHYRAVAAGASSSGANAELRLKASDGTAVPIYLSINPYSADGIDGFCVNVTDLTEQKRNEEIVASEKLARSILEQATEGIVVTDTDGRIVRANKAATDIAGQSILLHFFNDAFRLSFDGLDGEGQRLPYNSNSSILKTAFAGGTIQHLEARLARPGRDAVSVIVGVGPFTDAGGKVAGAIITLTDITDRKRSEEMIGKSNEQLRRANADLEQFAYSASHDLQQPIRNVAIYSQILERRCRESLDETGLECLSFMRSGALQMEKLIRDLLAYTRVSSEPETAPEEVNANEALEAARNDLSEAIRESGSAVTSDPLPLVKMRAVHLQQLFQNLVGNAIKYRSDQPASIHVSVNREKDAHRFSVRDNGLGIAPRYQRQIFGVFKRLYSEEKYAGTGIGLAICQRIVDRYGGRIWVESEPGKGSTFFFTVPGRS